MAQLQSTDLNFQKLSSIIGVLLDDTSIIDTNKQFGILPNNPLTNNNDIVYQYSSTVYTIVTNRNIRTFGFILPVINQQNTPPITPSTGDRYLIGTSPTGAWIGNANNIAEWNGTSWIYTTAVNNTSVLNTSLSRTLRFNGTSWVLYNGIPLLHNGNSLGSSLTIGTNDNFDINFITSGSTKATISSTGVFTINNSNTGQTLVINNTNISGAASSRIDLITNKSNILSNVSIENDSFQLRVHSVTNNRQLALFTENWNYLGDSFQNFNHLELISTSYTTRLGNNTGRKFFVFDNTDYRFVIENDNTLTVGNTTDYHLLVTSPNDIPNKQYVDNQIGTITPEFIQDSAFSILTDTTTIDLNYNDALNQVTATVIDNSITNTKLAQMLANTVKLNASGSTVNPQDFTINVNNVLGRLTGNITNIPLVDATISDIADITQLENPLNWDDSNSFQGTVTGTTQGQRYLGDRYWYYMFTSTNPIRVPKYLNNLMVLRTPITISTNAKTNITGSTLGTNTIVGGSIIQGTTFKINMEGLITSNSFNTMTVGIEVDTVTVSTSIPIGALSNQYFSVDFTLTFNTVGVNGKFRGQGKCIIGSSVYPIIMTANSADVDTDSNIVLGTSSQFSSGTNSLVVTNYTITRHLI